MICLLNTGSDSQCQYRLFVILLTLQAIAPSFSSHFNIRIYYFELLFNNMKPVIESNLYHWNIFFLLYMSRIHLVYFVFLLHIYMVNNATLKLCKAIESDANPLESHSPA